MERVENRWNWTKFHGIVHSMRPRSQWLSDLLCTETKKRGVEKHCGRMKLIMCL